MLIDLDDTLLHQAPLPFAYVASSDHRFCDRYWFEAVSPDGSVGIIVGMGRYPNMNVLDGFIAVQYEGKQHNVRFSRALRPNLGETKIGAFGIEIVQPLWTSQIVVEAGDRPVSAELTWSGTCPSSRAHT